MARGNNQHNQQPTISLDYGKPRDDGDMIAIDATATVHQNGLTVEGMGVCFFLETNPLPENTDATNEHGRVMYTYKVPKGTILVHIMAEVEGTKARAPRVVRLDKETKTTLTKKRIGPTTFRAEGNANAHIARYRISTFVFYENGDPAVGAVFEFSASLPYTPAPLDAEEQRMVVADQRGYCAYMLEFDEIEADLTISGPLTTEGKEFQQEIKNLQGPLRHLPPLKWKRPPEVARRLGFMAIMRWTRERIRAHKEKRELRAFGGVLGRKPIFIEVWIATAISRIRCALATNNNYRLLALWLVVGAWAFINLFIIGWGPPFKPQYTNLSDIAIRVFRRTRPELLLNMDPWSGYRFWSWILWPIGFLSALCYIPRALRDEWERAKSRAWRTLFEQRGKLPDVVASMVAEASAAGITVHQKQHAKTFRTGGEIGKFIGALMREIVASSIVIGLTH